MRSRRAWIFLTAAPVGIALALAGILLAIAGRWWLGLILIAASRVLYQLTARHA